MCRFQLCVGKATDFGNVPRNGHENLGVPACLRQSVGLSAVPRYPRSILPLPYGRSRTSLRLAATIPNAFFIISRFREILWKNCEIYDIITTMNASYKKLWKILIDRDMNKSDLIRQAKITSNIVAKMGKGEDVSMESLRKICIALGCEIGDIVEFTREDK